MKKYLLIASSFMLASPLVLAQTTPDPATPADPAIPANPATPADPAVPAQKTDKQKDGTKTPRASGSAKSGEGSMGATANPESGQGKAKGGMSGTAGDFASFDANGDGKLSKDEAKGNASINFSEMDRNGDGNVTRGEYESGVHASPKAEGQSKEPKPPKR